MPVMFYHSSVIHGLSFFVCQIIIFVAILIIINLFDNVDAIEVFVNIQSMTLNQEILSKCADIKGAIERK